MPFPHLAGIFAIFTKAVPLLPTQSIHPAQTARFFA